MRKLLIIAVLSLVAFPVAVFGASIDNGYGTFYGLAVQTASRPQGGSTFAMSAGPTGASGKQVAYGFIPSVNKTVTSLRIIVHSVNGTLPTSSMEVDLVGDNGASVPASSTILASSTAWSSAFSGTNFWDTVTGFSYAVTAGTLYWFLLKNNNATSSTNYPTLAIDSSNLQLFGYANNGAYGDKTYTTSNGGGSYAGSAGINARICYSDGTCVGAPLYMAGTDTNKVYSSNYSGLKWTLTGSSTLLYNAIGVAMPAAKSGSPTGNVYFALYNNTTLLATTTAIPLSTYTLGSWLVALFPSTVQLTGGEVIRIVLCDSATDSSSNYFYSYYGVWDQDASSTPLMPLGSTFQQTSYNGSSWTDQTNGNVDYAALLLDAQNPYTVSSTATASSAPSMYGWLGLKQALNNLLSFVTQKINQTLAWLGADNSYALK